MKKDGVMKLIIAIFILVIINVNFVLSSECDGDYDIVIEDLINEQIPERTSDEIIEEYHKRLNEIEELKDKWKKYFSENPGKKSNSQVVEFAKTQRNVVEISLIDYANNQHLINKKYSLESIDFCIKRLEDYRRCVLASKRMSHLGNSLISQLLANLYYKRGIVRMNSVDEVNQLVLNQIITFNKHESYESSTIGMQSPEVLSKCKKSYPKIELKRDIIPIYKPDPQGQGEHLSNEFCVNKWRYQGESEWKEIYELISLGEDYKELVDLIYNTAKPVGGTKVCGNYEAIKHFLTFNADKYQSDFGWEIENNPIYRESLMNFEEALENLEKVEEFKLRRYENSPHEPFYIEEINPQLKSNYLLEYVNTLLEKGRIAFEMSNYNVPSNRDWYDNSIPRIIRSYDLSVESYEEAIKFLSRLGLEKSEMYAYAQLGLSQTLKNKGNLLDAYEHMRLALEASPNNANIQEAKTRLQLETLNIIDRGTSKKFTKIRDTPRDFFEGPWSLWDTVTTESAFIADVVGIHVEDVEEIVDINRKEGDVAICNKMGVKILKWALEEGYNLEKFFYDDVKIPGCDDIEKLRRHKPKYQFGLNPYPCWAKGYYSDNPKIDYDIQNWHLGVEEVSISPTLPDGILYGFYADAKRPENYYREGSNADALRIDMLENAEISFTDLALYSKRRKQERKVLYDMVHEILVRRSLDSSGNPTITEEQSKKAMKCVNRVIRINPDISKLVAMGDPERQKELLFQLGIIPGSEDFPEGIIKQVTGPKEFHEGIWTLSSRSGIIQGFYDVRRYILKDFLFLGGTPILPIRDFYSDYTTIRPVKDMYNYEYTPIHKTWKHFLSREFGNWINIAMFIAPSILMRPATVFVQGERVTLARIGSVPLYGLRGLEKTDDVLYSMGYLNRAQKLAKFNEGAFDMYMGIVKGVRQFRGTVQSIDLAKPLARFSPSLYKSVSTGAGVVGSMGTGIAIGGTNFIVTNSIGGPFLSIPTAIATDCVLIGVFFGRSINGIRRQMAVDVSVESSFLRKIDDVGRLENTYVVSVPRNKIGLVKDYLITRGAVPDAEYKLPYRLADESLEEALRKGDRYVDDVLYLRGGKDDNAIGKVILKPEGDGIEFLVNGHSVETASGDVLSLRRIAEIDEFGNIVRPYETTQGVMRSIFNQDDIESIIRNNPKLDELGTRRKIKDYIYSNRALRVIHGSWDELSVYGKIKAKPNGLLFKVGEGVKFPSGAPALPPGTGANRNYKIWSLWEVFDENGLVRKKFRGKRLYWKTDASGHTTIADSESALKAITQDGESVYLLTQIEVDANGHIGAINPYRNKHSPYATANSFTYFDLQDRYQMEMAQRIARINGYRGLDTIPRDITLTSIARKSFKQSNENPSRSAPYSAMDHETGLNLLGVDRVDTGEMVRVGVGVGAKNKQLFISDENGVRRYHPDFDQEIFVNQMDGTAAVVIPARSVHKAGIGLRDTYTFKDTIVVEGKPVVSESRSGRLVLIDEGGFLNGRVYVEGVGLRKYTPEEFGHYLLNPHTGEAWVEVYGVLRKTPEGELVGGGSPLARAFYDDVRNRFLVSLESEIDVIRAGEYIRVNPDSAIRNNIAEMVKNSYLAEQYIDPTDSNAKALASLAESTKQKIIDGEGNADLFVTYGIVEREAKPDLHYIPRTSLSVFDSELADVIEGKYGGKVREAGRFGARIIPLPNGGFEKVDTSPEEMIRLFRKILTYSKTRKDVNTLVFMSKEEHSKTWLMLGNGERVGLGKSAIDITQDIVNDETTFDKLVKRNPDLFKEGDSLRMRTGLGDLEVKITKMDVDLALDIFDRKFRRILPEDLHEGKDYWVKPGRGTGTLDDAGNFQEVFARPVSSWESPNFPNHLSGRTMTLVDDGAGLGSRKELVEVKTYVQYDDTVLYQHPITGNYMVRTGNNVPEIWTLGQDTRFFVDDLSGNVWLIHKDGSVMPGLLHATSAEFEGKGIKAKIGDDVVDIGENFEVDIPGGGTLKLGYSGGVFYQLEDGSLHVVLRTVELTGDGNVARFVKWEYGEITPDLVEESFLITGTSPYEGKTLVIGTEEVPVAVLPVSGVPRTLSLTYGQSIAREAIPSIRVGPQVCFLPGTEINMADGSKKNIEEIEVGDDVLSWDFEDEEFVSGEVVDNFKRESDSYYVINGEIKVTGEHPFWVKRR